MLVHARLCAYLPTCMPCLGHRQSKHEWTRRTCAGPELPKQLLSQVGSSPRLLLSMHTRVHIQTHTCA